MPIYEYGCEDCGERFEVTQKITDNPLETCSKCNGKIKRLVSATAFHLKGTGWYKTDYASTNKESEKKEQAGATGKDEKKK
ncbi:MAG: FmdB family zinc ribbon protein [Nitrospinota bacterium]